MKSGQVKSGVSSLYIHFPFCKHLCNYCDFFKKIPGESNTVSAFQDLFCAQFLNQEKILENQGCSFEDLESLYIGGGTPSLWGKSGAVFLKSFFKEKGLNLKPGGEFTLELNPGGWDPQCLSAWQDFGINRFSIGIQSLDSRFLPILDRVHKLEDSLYTLDFFCKNKLNFSVDFMLGLPFSKTLRRDVLSELKRVLDYRPSHLSLYILTTGSNYIHREDLPDENWIEDEYLKVSNFLKERGFLHYEVSNFSLPGKESTHNLKYWDLESVAALGPSGTGFIKNGSEGFRYKWNVKGPTYTEEFLSEDQLLLEKIYLSLRTFKGINPCEVFTDEEVRESFLNLVEKWKGLGLLNSHESDHVSLSTKGFLLLDSFMDDIFSKKIIQ